MDDELEINTEELQAERKLNELLDNYRALFGGGAGLEVLADILRTCHFGCTLDPDNKVQVAEYNVGLLIAVKAGFLEKLENMLGLR